MTKRVMVLVGTKKGGFILDGDTGRRDWSTRGPLNEGWPIRHLSADQRSGTLYAGGGSEWYGPAVWRSDDLGATWTHSSEGLTYGEDGPAIETVWNVTGAGDALYAGVAPAGLFKSADGGLTWEHVRGLTDHPSRSTWQPGAGGLCLHSIVPHPSDPAKLWIAISAVGTFATEDGGLTWEPRNHGVRADFLPDPYPVTGQCVHKLVMAPGGTDRLYQENHCGTYRSDDAGRTWISLEDGLPSTFGFPMITHPRDPETAYTIPLNGDSTGRYMPDGQAAVWKTTDAGATWSDLRVGLPQEGAFLTVLREALAVDPLTPHGIYFGTTSGELFASVDEGASWRTIAEHLPSISSVETLVVDA